MGARSVTRARAWQVLTESLLTGRGQPRGKTGPTNPPAHGSDHVIIDGLNPQELNLQNTDLLTALREGGDAGNILDVFPTLADPTQGAIHPGLGSPSGCLDQAVGDGLNGARTDANALRQLAAQDLATSPGGTLLRWDLSVLNCPALGWEDEPPTRPQAPKPPQIPLTGSGGPGDRHRAAVSLPGPVGGSMPAAVGGRRGR